MIEIRGAGSPSQVAQQLAVAAPPLPPPAAPARCLLLLNQLLPVHTRRRGAAAATPAAAAAAEMSEVVLKVAMACEVRWAGATPACQPAAAGTLGALPPAAALTIGRTCVTPGMHLQTCQGFPHHRRPGCVLLQGCVGAVKRVAEKLEGVQSVDIDLPAQKVRQQCTHRAAALAPQHAARGTALPVQVVRSAAASLAAAGRPGHSRSRAALTPCSEQAAAMPASDPHVCCRCLLRGRSL